MGDNNGHLNPYNISSLSEPQKKAIALLPIIPSLLSTYGSVQLIFMILRKKINTPYRRIMLALSCSDFLNSIIYPWQAFLLPRATSQREWAIGNDTTCSALGFGQQISLIATWYNGMLSCYFLLTIRFGITDRSFARRFEPWMHVISIGFPWITAAIGSILGVYHELVINHGCWVANYPENCGSNTEIGESGAYCWGILIGWIFGGFPVLTCFFTILLNNVLIYYYVKSTVQRGRKRCYSRAQLSLSLELPHSDNRSFSVPPHERSRSFESDHSFRASSQRSRTIVDPAPSERSRTIVDPQLKRIREVARQALSYVMAFLLTYTTIMALQVSEAYGYTYAKDEATLFPVSVLNSILFPSQGLLNLLVYIRPTYIKARRDFPKESRLWAIRRALHGDKILPWHSRDASISLPKFETGTPNASALRISEWDDLPANSDEAHSTMESELCGIAVMDDTERITNVRQQQERGGNQQIASELSESTLGEILASRLSALPPDNNSEASERDDGNDESSDDTDPGNRWDDILCVNG